MADVPGLHTVSIKRVHILSEGEWTGVAGGEQKYTRADLLAFAKNHARILALGAYVPQYIHHNDDPLLPDQPTVGMLDRLYVEDDDDGLAGLYTDLTDVPIQIAQLMKLKSIRGRSIEGIRVKTRKGFTVKGERFDQVITGLALLGTALPAVDGLEDIPEFINLFEMDDSKVAAGKDARGVVFDFDVPFTHAAYDTGGDLPPEDLGDALDGTPTAPELTDGEKKEMVLVAWKAKNKPTADEYPYVDDIDSTTAYVCVRGDLFAVPYVIDGNAATIGTPSRVRRGITYIPISASKGSGGGAVHDALTALSVLAPRVLAMAREATANPNGSQAALNRVMLALDALGGELVGLVAGQRGAPIVRSRIRALKEEVLRIVGATANAKGNGMDLKDILQAFGLAADADEKTVATALAKATKEPSTKLVTALLALADVGTGGDFANPEQFVAWLAGKLGVAPGNLGALAAAIATELGDDPGDAPVEDPTAAPAPAPTAMSKGDKVAEAPDVIALRRKVEEQEASLAKLTKWQLEQIATVDKNAAESRVDAAITLGKFDASRRDELVTLAKASPEAFDAVVGTLPAGASVPVGRFSHGRAPAAPDALEPSEEQISAVMASGVRDRDRAVAMARAANYDEAGVPLPAAKKEA